MPSARALDGCERVCTRPRRQRPVPGSGSAQGSTMVTGTIGPARGRLRDAARVRSSQAVGRRLKQILAAIGRSLWTGRREQVIAEHASVRRAAPTVDRMPVGGGGERRERPSRARGGGCRRWGTRLEPPLYASDARHQPCLACAIVPTAFPQGSAPHGGVSGAPGSGGARTPRKTGRRDTDRVEAPCRVRGGINTWARAVRAGVVGTGATRGCARGVFPQQPPCRQAGGSGVPTRARAWRRPA